MIFFTSFVVTLSQPPHVRRPLTDDVINHIAMNRLTHQISRLGLAMGFPRAMITKYEAENREEPRAESRGTKNMIHHWREECTATDQVDAFSAVLREAQLNELAGEFSSGIILNFKVILCKVYRNKKNANRCVHVNQLIPFFRKRLTYHMHTSHVHALAVYRHVYGIWLTLMGVSPD